MATSKDVPGPGETRAEAPAGEVAGLRRRIAELESELAASLRDRPSRRSAEADLERSEARTRALLASLLDPTVAIDAFGIIYAMSDSVERVFGYAPRELVGRNVCVLMPEPHRSSHDGYLENYRRTGQTNILGRTREFEVVCKNGSRIPCDLSVGRADLPEGGGALFIGSFRDASERKRAEEALRAEAGMLRALATIGESAALLAHEIKNPITAVHVALRAVAEKLGEDHRAVLEDLVARMKHLEQLMRRTLSFARPLETKRAEVDARELLDRTVARLADLIARSGSEVRVEAEPGKLRFVADPSLIEEVVSNLVANAIEAKPREARVVLKAATAGEDDLLITVEDDGPGIPRERREAIFKPFVTTKPSGTGLGLAICRKIVGEHGGTIRVEEGATGGARFVVQLPART